ncbi:ABC transporter permease [Paenibacillus alvei]|uniref:ABC transporter permease n=1 Tax=Paenibacillus alvei TaxID=44250 RepID=UPI0019D63E4B
MNLLKALGDIKNNRKVILSLAKNDFKSKYAGSYLGAFWAFFQPIITIFVFWFVFQVGLRVTPVVSEVPFALWFITGIIPWFFFSDALMSATNCFYEFNYLVKKVVFKISILPIIKILSALMVHAFFIVFLFVVYFCYGYSINFIAIMSVLYYSMCAFLLVLGLSYITSSINVFFKDLGQIVGIVVQFGMWLTPIMWSTKLIPEGYKWIFEMNPMYYVVEGYRSALLGTEFLSNYDGLTLWFWSIVVINFIIGAIVFKKLKAHFADVL